MCSHEICTNQRKQISELKSKYTKAKANNCDNTTATQLIKIINDLKAKLASSQEAYNSLLAKMETMCKHCDELTNKVANLEAVSTTPTKASKKKSSIFNMSKKDASTSCNDLCLDSPLCNQVCVEKVIIDTCTQEVAKENEQLKQEVARLTKDLTQVKGKAK